MVKYTCVLLALIICATIYNVQGYENEEDDDELDYQLRSLLFQQRTAARTIINAQNFKCVFNTLDDKTRGERLNGLKKSGYKPQNADEAAVFLAHVFQETGGLKTLTESCAPGKFI
jgi:hypothetical protein